ncbi:putative long-distance movement protein [Patrinia mild mottle virus]|uniref:Putative long-distance movement protein n=1 Tax=Patrinia mild mottle virus TaxID=2518104 RepID=A0A411I645_9TOMB|nr:putative long-distance movement protein [Patrinia mild mottle virus]QBB78570.1 putative long-distance movement protein [Patrinia mild mottle virus]
MTAIINVYPNNQGEQQRGTPRATGSRTERGAGRIRTGENRSRPRGQQDRSHPAASRQGATKPSVQAATKASNKVHRGTSVHPSARSSVCPPRPRPLPRHRDPMGPRSDPPEQQRRVRQSDLAPEQWAAIRPLSTALLNTVGGFGGGQAKVLQRCLRAIRYGHSEWRKRIQPIPNVGAGDKSSGTQLPPTGSDSVPSQEGSPPQPPADQTDVKGPVSTGHNKSEVCEKCRGSTHPNVY